VIVSGSNMETIRATGLMRGTIEPSDFAGGMRGLADESSIRVHIFKSFLGN